MSILYKQIGEKIRALRATRPELSQEKLAKEMETTANTISRWETAQYKPSAADLERLSRFFGVSISYFFPELQGQEARLQALLSATGDLSEGDLNEILRYAEFRRARSLMEKK